MKLRKRQTGYFGLNTTSTADISFMLLVFFLVTTSMYAGKGIIRHLPPKDRDNAENREIAVEKENTAFLTLDASGSPALNDSARGFRTLQAELEDFILSRGKEHLIIIDADGDCPYGAYYAAQNAVSEAYRGAREKSARKLYGRGMASLSGQERLEVMKNLPRRVAENYRTEGER